MFQVRDFPEAMYTVEAIIMMHTHSKLSLASHLRRRQAKFSKCSHTHTHPNDFMEEVEEEQDQGQRSLIMIGA